MYLFMSRLYCRIFLLVCIWFENENERIYTEFY